MKKNNVVQEKSYAFALACVELYKKLQQQQQGYVLSRQLIRSATSIGANIEEALGAQSRKDFFAKLSIAYKEARETHYWLRLLRDSHLLSPAAAKKKSTTAKNSYALSAVSKRQLNYE